MNAYAKRNYFLSEIRAVKGNKEAKNYLVNYYYSGDLSLEFFDQFSIETIKTWDIKKQVTEIQEIINAN